MIPPFVIDCDAPFPEEEQDAQLKHAASACTSKSSAVAREERRIGHLPPRTEARRLSTFGLRKRSWLSGTRRQARNEPTAPHRARGLGLGVGAEGARACRGRRGARRRARRRGRGRYRVRRRRRLARTCEVNNNDSRNRYLEARTGNRENKREIAKAGTIGDAVEGKEQKISTKKRRFSLE